MNGYYGKEGYVSVWLGNCENETMFNEYIMFRERDDETQSRFKLGEDFGIMYYDDSCSLVNYLPERTKDLDVLLDCGAPDYVIDTYKELLDGKLSNLYNCCVMFYEMKFTGEVLKTIKSKYGFFTFIGSIEADVMDI